MLLFKNEPLTLGEQLSIWHEVIGKGVSLHERFNSPFRPSKSMSCSLHEFHGKILFSSFSEKDKPFVGWTAEKAHIFLKGTDFRHLLKYQRSFESKPKAKTVIIPNIIEWDLESFLFWMDLGVNPLNTIVKPISGYLINKVIHPRLPSFAYIYSPDEIKIYSPFESKSFKWRGTVKHTTTVWSKSGSNILVVSKALKDQLVMQSLIGNKVDIIHPQSETNTIPHSIDYEHVYVLFDNDETGEKNGMELAEKIKGKAIFVPEGKDLAEYYKIVGRKNTFDWLTKTIINEKDKENN
jgi:5S rRNA maturation endonuclease (ribonuclease M5)